MKELVIISGKGGTGKTSVTASFAALAAESASTGLAWDLVFVASLDGRAGIAPSSDEAAQPLRLMVNAVNDGQISRFAAFDRDGAPVQFY